MYEMKQEYLTGIPLVDEEHSQIFDYANQIYALLKNPFMVDKYDHIKDLLVKLSDYAKQHFADEEAYMESINYKRLFTQKIHHQQFIEQLDKYDMQVMEDIENQDELIENMLNFVTEWLVQHILEVDMLIGK